MSHRALGALLLLVAVIGVLAGVPASGASTASAPAPPDTVVVVDNEFVPDRDLDDCVSALPQPDCGSDTRSGWRQWAIFGLLVVALSFIGWRIVRSARRSRPRATVLDDT